MFLDIQVSDKKNQPLLSRTAVKGYVGFEAVTPSRTQLKEKLAESLNADPATIAVKSIRTEFSKKKARFEAHIYDSAQNLEKNESTVVLRRIGVKPKKQSAGKADTKKK